MHPLITSNSQKIGVLCRRFHVRSLGVFGSALRDDFEDATSDVDLVVEFDDVPGSGMRRYFDLKTELEKLFNRTVDLVELGALQESRLKRLIQRGTVPVYAEAAGDEPSRFVSGRLYADLKPFKFASLKQPLTCVLTHRRSSTGQCQFLPVANGSFGALNNKFALEAAPACASAI